MKQIGQVLLPKNTDVLKTLLERAKQRSKQFNVPYDLNEEWLKEKLEIGFCELSGLKFEHSSNPDWRASPFCPSIDRIIPSQGYTKENGRVICFCVNMARSNWGDDVLFKMCKAIINNNKAIINA